MVDVMGLNEEDPSEKFDGQSEEQTSKEDRGLGRDASEFELEGKLNEFYKKYYPNKKNGDGKNGNGKVDLLEQLAATDRMALFLFEPPKIEDMSREEQEAYSKHIARKMAVYDFSKRCLRVNPYNLEAKRFLRKAKEQRDTLEYQLNEFLAELRGGAHQTNNGEVYRGILEEMPDYIKQDSKFGPLMDYLNGKANGSKNSKGLKDEFNAIEGEAIWLADLYDFFSGAMTDFDKKIEETTNKIKGFNGRLAKTSKDKDLMQERARENAFLTKYKEEKEKLAYARDDISNRLDVIEFEIDSIGDRVAIREVAIAKSRRSLARLNAAINRVEDYRRSKQDMIVVTDHVMTMQQVQDYIKQAESVGIAFSGVAKKVYKNLAERESELGDTPYSRSNRDLHGMRDRMNTERDERVENVIARLRNRAYN